MPMLYAEFPLPPPKQRLYLCCI